jgi:hypothetical protein
VSAFKPSAASFKSLIAAINSGNESELETAVTWIALAAKRNSYKSRKPARKTSK